MENIGIVGKFVFRSKKIIYIMLLCVLLIILLQIYLQSKQYEVHRTRSCNKIEEFNDTSYLDITEFSSTLERLEDLIAENSPKHNQSARSLCQEQPPDLVGKMNIRPTVSLEEVTKETSLINLSFGGRYAPSNCKARERTAVIIPYRDRKEHLEICVRHLHAVLQRQELDYGIYVVEMALPTQFNRGLLANAGVSTVRGISHYTCYIIHDVDMLMTDDRNLYRCGNQPIDYVTFSTKHGNHSMSNSEYYGGVVGFTEEQYKKCNGFSNLYFGWGGEDDDLGIRVKRAGMKFVRPRAEIGNYVALPHKGDVSNQQNPNRYALLSHAKARMMEEGVDSILFKRFALESRKLYTWILIGVQEDIILKKYQKYLEDTTSRAWRVPSTTLINLVYQQISIAFSLGILFSSCITGR